MKNKSRFILCGIILLLIFLIIPGFYNAMHVVRYNLHSAKIGGKISIALITDLHSCSYGTGQSTLIDTIDKEKPDLVLLGGDIFDQNLPDDNAVAFLQKVSSRYPCYFVTGNHEYHKGKHAFSDRMAILDACGITRLSGEMASVEINGTHLSICGLDDPYEWAEGIEQTESDLLHFHEQLKKVASLPKDDASYTILLTHRPEMFELYRQYDFDLVLAGHAHGGQWRIPGILNGLYAPGQGLFPAYAGGQYEQNGTTMIVSRGLALESTWVPRFYNRPELVIVTLEGANQ